MQEELAREIIAQGEREDIARHLSRLLKTKEQQAMMKYLVSIRKERVRETEVIQVAVKISETL